MAYEPLPDGIAEGEDAYVLVDHHVAGVGSYDTAIRVRVVRINATHVRVIPKGDGEVGNLMFRRRDLTAPRTGRGWATDNRLVPVGDARVRRALAVGEIMAAADYAAVQAAAEAMRRLSPARVANDLDGEIDGLVGVLDEAIEAATRSRAALLRVRGVSA